eukprot:502740_1
MNALKRAFTPKRKKKELPPLKGVKRSASKQILDSPNNDNKNESQSKKRKNKKGQFTLDNLYIKEFTDKEIKQCFDDFDLDGNGFICTAEIMQCLRLLGEIVTDEEVDEMIKLCDKNGDGQIEFEEFQEMIYKEAGIHRTLGGQSMANGLNRMATKHCITDINALQQQRNRAERLKELLEILQFETKSMTNIHNNFVLMDDGGNSDGRPPGLIDYADFCACTKVAVTHQSKELFALFEHETFGAECIDYRFFLISLVSMLAPNLEMKIKFTFDVFDIDGNGLIDKQELTAVVAATQLLKGKALTERVDKIMNLADADGNQELDFEEFAVCCRRYQSLLFPKL